MKKMLFVLLAVAICASFVSTASATTYNFTLRDVNGNAYCDGYYLVQYKIYSYAPKSGVDGYHWNNDCAGDFSGVNGFKAGVSTYYQYNATGAALVVGDPWLGEYLNGYNTMTLVNPVYHTWIYWLSNYGSGEYILNYGTWINGATPTGTKSSRKR